MQGFTQEIHLAVKQASAVHDRRWRSDILTEAGEEGVELGVAIVNVISELVEGRRVRHHLVQRRARSQRPPDLILLAAHVVQPEQRGGVAEGGVGRVLLGQQPGEYPDVAAELLVGGGQGEGHDPGRVQLPVAVRCGRCAVRCGSGSTVCRRARGGGTACAG